MNKDVKTLIKKIIIIGGMVFIIMFIVNLLYITRVEAIKQYTVKNNQWEEYVETHNETEYIIIGDSRARNGISPLYLGESFNLAHGGSGPKDHYYEAKKLIDSGLRTKYVIISIEPFSCSTQRTKKGMAYKQFNYYKEFVPMEIIAEEYEQWEIELWIMDKIPSLFKGIEILYILKPPQRSDIDRGQFVTDKVANYKTDKELQRALTTSINNHYGNKKEINYSILTYINKTVDVLHRHNITVIGIHMPYTEAYLDELKKRSIHITDFEEFITNHTNIDLYLDYSEALKNCKECFTDIHHLNSYGASRLTRLIKEDIRG